MKKYSLLKNLISEAGFGRNKARAGILAGVKSKTFDVTYTEKGKKVTVRVQALGVQGAKDQAQAGRASRKIISAVEVK